MPIEQTNHKIKTFYIPIIVLTILCVLPLVFLYINNNKSRVDPAAQMEAGLLINFSNDNILYQKHIHNKRSPASLTKLMTSYVILDIMNANDLSWDESITISRSATEIEGSKLWLVEGETITIHDLFQAMLIASANDATLALVEHIAGSSETFVLHMNQKAIELELHNTHFIEPTGLSNAENHFSTAFDLAMLSKHLIKDYGEQLLKITAQSEATITLSGDKKLILSNTNPLIIENGDYDGLKTGYTEQAGYNLIATKNTSSGRLISVVLGCQRKKDRKRVTEYLFQTYQENNNKK
jgi:serine-type D-Ala-D-Ala carboxypeptidase (penicillin-binding protein 5/6)